MTTVIKHVLEEFEKDFSNFEEVIRIEEGIIEKNDLDKLLNLSTEKEQLFSKMMCSSKNLKKVIASDGSLFGKLIESSSSDFKRRMDLMKDRINRAMYINERNFLKIRARAMVDEEFLRSAGAIKDQFVYSRSF